MANKTSLIELPLLCVFTAWLTILLQFQDPFWAVITVVVLYVEPKIHPVLKAFWRLIGTFSGYGLGLLTVMLFANHPFTLLCALFLIILLFTYLGLSKSSAYAYYFCAITAFIVILSGFLNIQNTVAIGAWRSADVALGVLIIALYCIVSPKEKVQQASPIDNSIDHHKNFMRALKVSTSCVITASLFLWIKWYGSIIGVISAFLIAIPEESSQSLITGFERSMGCFFGAVAGLLTLILVAHNLFFLFLAIFFTTTIYYFLHLKYPQYAYMKLQAIVAFLIAIMPESNVLTNNVDPALERLAGIIAGVIIAVIVNTLFNACAITEGSYKNSLLK